MGYLHLINSPIKRIGIRRFDEEHENLYKYLTEARALFSGEPKTDGTIKLLTNLHPYMARHFEEEEELMMKCGYPELSKHVLQHRKLLERLRTLIERYQADPSTSPAELVVFVMDWLHDHLENSDTRYVDCLRACGID